MNPLLVRNTIAVLSAIFIGTCISHSAISKMPLQESTKKTTAIDQADRLFTDGTNLYKNGKYKQAIEHYQKALAIQQENREQPRIGRTLNAIGLAYYRLNQFSTALSYYESALKIFKEERIKSREGSTLNNIGAVYTKLGQFNKALSFYESALKILEKTTDYVEKGNAINNLGTISYHLSRYVKALAYYQQALSLSRQVRDLKGEGLTLHSIGSTYSLLGQHEKAVEHFKQALTILRKSGDTSYLPGVFNSLGFNYIQQKNYLKALESFQEALKLIREIEDKSAEGYALSSLSLVHLLLGKPVQARDELKLALLIARETGDRYLEGGVLDGLGEVYRKLGQYSQALNSHITALLIMREIEDKANERLALSNLGDLFAVQQQPELAILFYKQSVNVTEAIRKNLRPLPRNYQESYTQTVADTYRKLAGLLLQQNRVLEAQQVLELLKMQELDDYLRNVRGVGQQIAFFHPEEQIIAKYRMLEKNVVQLGKELNELESLERKNLPLTPQQQSRKAELVQIRKEVNQQFNQFLRSEEVKKLMDHLRVQQPQALSLESFNASQDNLEKLPGAVLLYPLVLDDRIELILTTPHSPPIRRVVTLPSQQLKQTVLEFRQALHDPSQDAKPSAQKLYKWLFAELEPLLKQANAQTIVYAPDGLLRYIPLAALHDGKQWLVERYRINNITAQSLIDFNTPTKPQPRVLMGAFASGSFSVQVGDRPMVFKGLPFAGREVEFLSRSFTNATKLVDRDFSRSAVEVQANTKDIIHLATHAAFVTGSPEDSFILFGDGSLLRLREIPDWVLKNVDLVVLSACETGVGGQFSTGVEILGLGYQFQRAGAKAAIASLWSVDDGGTQELMNAFYAALKQGNITKAEALQKAQIEMIRQGATATGQSRNDSFKLPTGTDSGTPISRNLSHPYYWAPFILIGNGL